MSCVIVHMLGHCDNCSEIIMDGISKDNNETLCKRISDDLIIAAKFPIVFHVISFAVWVDGSNSRGQNICDCNIHTLICNCSNLTATSDGTYTIHSILDTMVMVMNGSRSLEWLSNKVEVIVQSMYNIEQYTIYIHS